MRNWREIILNFKHLENVLRGKRRLGVLTQFAPWFWPSSRSKVCCIRTIIRLWVRIPLCYIDGSSRGRTDKIVLYRCWTDTQKNPTKFIWRWEPDRRSTSFLMPLAHRSMCRHKYNWNIGYCDVKLPINQPINQPWFIICPLFVRFLLHTWNTRNKHVFSSANQMPHRQLLLTDRPKYKQKTCTRH